MDEATLQEIIRRIVQVAQPEKIILSLLEQAGEDIPLRVREAQVLSDYAVRS